MRFSTLFLALLLSTCVSAQNILQGTIRDFATGDPLPYATIYVQNTQSGAASNAEGKYAVKLGPGRNTVVFQYLGYQTLVKQVSGSQTLDIKLNPEALELNTVEIISGGEDISYSVIRRAIAKADYHLNQVEKYKADMYVRGTGEVHEVSKVIKLLAGKEGRKEIAEAMQRPFTKESTSVIHYERPNTFHEEVKRVYTVGDEQIDVMGFLYTTFYQPLIADVIVSPLHPRAFGYYRYEQEGTFIDQDQLINKIKVTPRSRGEDVVEGYIYIVQDDWSLHSVDVTTPKLGFDIRISQRYAEVLDHTWMPITTKADIEGSVLGVTLDFHYISTMSNYEIELNPDLEGYVEVIDEKSQPELAARNQGKRSVGELEEALGNGEKITRKDLRRLMRTYKKQEREERDEPEVISNVTVIDSNAVTVKDSAAWAKVRPVPLTAQERRGYQIADSLKQIKRARRVASNQSTTTQTPTVKADTTKRRFRAFRRQRLRPMPFFNPVRGYVLGGEVHWGNQIKQFGFGIKPSYGFADESLYAELSARYGRAGFEEELWHGWSATPLLRLTGGQGLRQFNPTPAIDPWLSTATNLLMGKNYIRLYHRQFVQLDFNKSLADEVRIFASIAYEDRKSQFNHSDDNWLGLDDGEGYAPNTPVNKQLGEGNFYVQDALTIDAVIRYQPGLKYYMRNGRRRLIEDSAPTLTFRVRQGVPNVGKTKSDFTQLEASYLNRFDVGRKGRVQLLARVGGFVNNNDVSFPDFKHFKGSEIVLVAADPLRSYRLLPYYEESTSEEYAEIYAHYQFRKFLLTQITLLNLYGIREDLFVNYLYTPTSDHYTEIGYSLDKIFRVARIEFVTSWREGKYEDFGVRIGVATSLADL